MLELSAWRNALEAPILEWSITQPNLEPRAIRLGDSWGFSDGTNGYNTHKQGAVKFETSVTIPDSLKGFPVELELDFGGEGFVLVTNSSGTVFRGGLNPFHKAFPILEKAEGGETFQIIVEAVPKGLFGSRNDVPSLARSYLVAPHLEVRRFLQDLESVHMACATLGAHEVVPHLLNATEDVLEQLPWTSSAEDYLSRLMHGTLGNPFERSILWSLPKIPELRPLERNWLLGVNAAGLQLQTHLENIKKLYPPQGSLALTGHAHIDLAWLWTISETRRKIRRTFATVLDLMNRYPDFKFNQSSAQAYAWLEQDDPKMFEEVKARILEGRWEAIGGMWVEPDGQMLNGESWVRQIQYGQHYFLEKFGQISTVSWLPDTFGFNPQLPQLLRLGGMDKFFTTKLRWNETTEFPHDLFIWQGLDGSKVLAHCFWNQFDSYNAQIDAKSLLETWKNYKGKSSKAWLKHPNPPQTLLAFGYGDGGGGPSREHLEGYARFKDFPAMPKLEMTRVDDFYAKLPTDLPVWHGEMYLELHRGTLTSQAKVKKLHRQLEHRLLEAEALWSLAWLEGESYPTGELELLWKTLLLHQFHDILPGSSIREVYEDAHSALGTALFECTVLLENAPVKGNTRLAFDQILARAQRKFARVSIQKLENSTYQLKNDLLSVLVNQNGWVESVKDKIGTEYLQAPMQFTAQHDVPREWEAWDVNPKASAPIQTKVEIVLLETGLKLIHTWRDSVFTQVLTLEAGRLVVKNHVQWHEKRVHLRLEIPVGIQIQHAYFENAFGAVPRAMKANTPTEAAAFEVPAHRFVLLEAGGQAMALLNDSKYGFSLDDQILSMSLLRGTMYPDPTADLGEHEFSYALQILEPTNTLETATKAGIDFNSPMLGALQHLFQTSGLVVSSLSKSSTNNALLLRLYEPSGRAYSGLLDLDFLRVQKAVRVDFLERQLEELKLKNGQLKLQMKPHEIITLKLFVVVQSAVQQPSTPKANEVLVEHPQPSEGKKATQEKQRV